MTPKKAVPRSTRKTQDNNFKKGKMRKVLTGITVILSILFFILPFYYLWQGYIQSKDLLNLLWIIPLTIVALFQDKIKNELFSPAILVEFQLKEPFCLKTIIRHEVNSSVGHCFNFNESAYYFRFRIKNKGLNQAKLTECIAESLSRYKDSAWVKDDTFQPINLNWSNAKSLDEFLNINPKCPGWFCDLAHIAENQKKMFIDYKEPYPNSQLNVIEPNIKHRIKVSVYSENAKPVSKEFEIYWSGQWKNNSREMFKEITIN